MRAIEITGDELKSILKHLPKELRDKLISEAKKTALPDNKIEIVKKFVDRFEDDCVIDCILSHTIGVFLVGAGGDIGDLMDEHKKKDVKGMHGEDAAKIVVRNLRKIADDIQQALDDHECSNDCEHH